MEPHPTVVLLAEDDPDMRDLIRSHLIHAGIQVVEVKDGVELHDYLVWCRLARTDREPHVVVSDINMPRESGPRALHRAQVRQPVILITAALTPRVRAEAAAAGVRAIFAKPFVCEQLVAKIREILLPPNPIKLRAL